MKDHFSRFKKNWIRLWLLVISSASLLFIAYAAYTEVYSVKRVISTTSSPGVPFSSNCMKTTLTSRRFSETSNVYPVTVCNFDQDFPKNWNTSDIDYDLTAELRVKLNNEYLTFPQMHERVDEGKIEQSVYDKYVERAANYWIEKTEDDGSNANNKESYKLSDPEKKIFEPDTEQNFVAIFENEKLITNKSSMDVYQVTIDDEDRTRPEAEFFVYLTAKPKTGVNTNLYARLYGMKSDEGEAASWRGSFLETDQSKDYDFFNYVINGSGQGGLDILWDSENLTINKFFLEENNIQDNQISTIAANDTNYGSAVANGKYVGWSKITLPINDDKNHRFEIQMYKTKENTVITDPLSYVHCDESKTTQTGS